MRALDAQLSNGTRYGWLWSVAVETSTGASIDVAMLARVARRRGVPVCLDCMSAIGTMPLDLRDVYLASASSGKGLASVAGLALVLTHAAAIPQSLSDTPASLDLALHLRDDGVAHTVPSALVAALHASVRMIASSSAERYAAIASDQLWLRNALRRLGLFPLVSDNVAAHSVLTLPLPASVAARAVGTSLREQGVDIGFESGYLKQRNWIQIALMGDYARTSLRRLPQQIEAAVRASTRRAVGNAARCNALNETPCALPNFSLAE
jgi:aspartate aminotransferase-like enzyme